MFTNARISQQIQSANIISIEFMTSLLARFEDLPFEALRQTLNLTEMIRFLCVTTGRPFEGFRNVFPKENPTSEGLLEI